jgi:hypothetical protein
MDLGDNRLASSMGIPLEQSIPAIAAERQPF